jgi:hypothetical protein
LSFKCVDNWHAPDHTKIEKFRNRLSSKTQQALANSIAKLAVDLGFGDPTKVDFDSTVQEAWHHLALRRKAYEQASWSRPKNLQIFPKKNMTELLPEQTRRRHQKGQRKSEKGFFSWPKINPPRSSEKFSRSFTSLSKIR